MTNVISTVSLTPAAANFLSAFNGAVDNFCTNGTKFDVSQLFNQSKLRDADVIAIQTKLQKTTDELELLVIDADEQITEGYSNLTKAQQRDLLSIYHAVMERKIVKSRKVKPTDGVIRVAASVVKVTESFDTVFAICDKYKAVRVFDGNVKVTGNTVKADQVYQVRMKKTDDLLSLKDMTKAEVMSFIESGTSTVRIPTTLSGDTIDFVLKF